MDTPRLIQKLKELGVTQYFYLVWHAPTDWDDFRHEFLPAARQAGIDVWVYLVPPSEAHRIQSEPFGTDYIAWFRAIGSLSRNYANLKGVVMDDFNHNLSFFTPEYVAKMKQAAKKSNRDLLFYPQIYYSAIHPHILEKYRSLFDGVVMTFRDGKYRNTQRNQDLEEQISKTSRLLAREGLPLILMVHASKLSATPSNPSAHYVEESLRTGLRQLHHGNIQGLVTYVLHKEWFPERRDHAAYSGDGYGSLFIPSGPAPAPGNKGEIRQLIRPKPSGKYELRFHHMSVYPRNLRKGEYVKQILIGDRVVWEEDVRAGEVEKWKGESLNLTPHLRGKKETNLTLRLVRKGGKSPSWLYIGFDRLDPLGFQLTQANFEEPSGWSYHSNHPAIIGETLIYDPKRRLRVYLISMMMYQSFHLFHEISSSAPFPLQQRADAMLQSVIAGQTQHVGHDLKLLKRTLEQTSTVPPSQKKKWIHQIDRLDRLLTINP
ncbi:hypothetical protein JOD24_003072 [Kroppenstedtia sanguinis]|uniref:Uncharacterized protein n=1 Tax=Kroppenstedtia sanguinis TaxID=1380684 RepID=A0ABW4C5N4_9BACL